MSDQIQSADNISEPSSQNIANIQQNFHFVQNIDISKLNELSLTDKDLADRIMKLYESQLEHSKKIDDFIMQAEEKEQNLRINDIPHQRKYAFRGQYLSVFIAILGLGLSTFSIYHSYPWVAGLSISIPVGIVAVNLLGIKNKNQK